MFSFKDIILNKEMANLRPSDTELPRTIYVSPSNITKHDARIKISNTTTFKFDPFDTFSITVSDKPEVIGKPNISKDDLNKIMNFILINKELLIKLWDDEISVKNFFDTMKTGE